MSKTLKIVLAANLIILAILVFAYPHLMVGPGKLIPGHTHLEADCFACHAPFLGTSTDRCMTCHKPADIGKLTTKGLPIQEPLAKSPFHQTLVKQDCVACHSDHAGVKRLRSAGRFNHDMLQVAVRNECQSCHKAPSDSLHQQIAGSCSQCHTPLKWVPATFDHNKHFVLDRDHNETCATCHVRNDYSRYTCYGCHEHAPDKIRREHMEEGIRDFANCAQCHRSANEHDVRMPGSRSERSGGGNAEREDD